ncbi:MAG: DUF433 domain-containing protein [bacterium]|nr:DUF433 domain-containing protein [bacterium]
MAALDRAVKALSQLRRAEKAEVLQWIVNDLGDTFPGIECTEGISGGEPRIVRTRIPVWVLVQARRRGTSESELLGCYPALRSEDLANAWAYYCSHQADIERQIRENEAA